MGWMKEKFQKVKDALGKKEIGENHLYDIVKCRSSFGSSSKGNETEKLVANEIAITHAYYDPWQKEGIEKPDTDDFHLNCAKAKSVFDRELKVLCSPDEHAAFLENIRQINENFREIAEENPEQFRSALKDEIARARTLNDFTTRLEDWAWDGMVQLGISRENFDESYSKFLANPHVTEETFSKKPVSDIVDSYQRDQPGKIVRHYEGFMLANTSLWSIYDQLHPGVSVPEIPKHIDIQDKPEQKISRTTENRPVPFNPFSNNETEKSIANEIAITRAYYDPWQKGGIEKPDTDDFHLNCARAESVFDRNLKVLRSPDEHAAFLENTRQINENFREIAEENPEQFRPALKDAIARARTLNEWAKNFVTRFGLEENWVRDGMGKQGISRENFDESYNKFLANPHLFDPHVLFETNIHAADDVAGYYKVDQIVQTYEEFVRANTSLEYINCQLKAGVPVSRIPERILGQKVIPVSGAENDCLIRALLTGAHSEWSERLLEGHVGEARKHVIEKLKEREEAVYDTENRTVERGDQLNLGGDAGQILIEYLRSSSCLDRERPIFVYQYRYSEDKIQCFEAAEGSPGKRPYAVLRESINEMSGHYWAIKDKEEES